MVASRKSEEERVADALKKLDTDGDGMVTAEEVAQAAKRVSTLKHKIRKCQMTAFVIFIVCLVVFGAFLGIVILANTAQGRLEASKSGLLRDRKHDKRVMRTGEAIFQLSVDKLRVLGLDDLEKLSAIDIDLGPSAGIRTVRVAGYSYNKGNLQIFSYAGQSLSFNKDGSPVKYRARGLDTTVTIKGILTDYPTKA